jgi:cell division protein FtsB
MTAPVIVMKLIRGPRWRVVAGGAVAVVVLVLAVLGSNTAMRYGEMQKHAENLQREIQRLEAVNDQLSRTIDRLRQDPQLIEQIAREELGLVRPGDRVLRFPRNSESRGGTSQGPR